MFSLCILYIYLPRVVRKISFGNKILQKVKILILDALEAAVISDYHSCLKLS